jgi:hypothetical protein
MGQTAFVHPPRSLSHRRGRYLLVGFEICFLSFWRPSNDKLMSDRRLRNLHITERGRARLQLRVMIDR